MALSKMEELQLFKAKLNALPLGFEVAILRYYEKLTKTEIAKILEVKLEDVNAALISVENIWVAINKGQNNAN